MFHSTEPPHLHVVALKSTRRLAVSAARCSAKLCLSSGVTLVSSLVVARRAYKVLRGLCHELAPPEAVPRQWSPVGEGSREAEVGEVALKPPAVGHFLAAGDAKPQDL